ncbi:hypothetical protein D3C71_1780780 [compost metagenome]
MAGRFPGDVLGYVQRWPTGHSGAASPLQRRSTATGIGGRLALPAGAMVGGFFGGGRRLGQQNGAGCLLLPADIRRGVSGRRFLGSAVRYHSQARD